MSKHAQFRLQPAGGAATDVQIFTATGANTWIRPTAAQSVDVWIIGGGGGGGSGYSASPG